MDADPEGSGRQPFGLGGGRERAEERLGGPDGHVGGGEFGKRAVTEKLDDSPAMTGHDLARDTLEAVHEPHRLALVLFGQPRVADHVREPHRREVMR